MKKLLVICIVALVIFTSCTSIVPTPGSITTALDPEDYKVLGLVKLESKVTTILGFTFGGYGYEEIVAQAVAQYPECEQVIDIHTQVKTTSFFPFYGATTVTYYGTAVDVL